MTVANFDVDLEFAEKARKLLERELYAKWGYEGRYVSIGMNTDCSRHLQKHVHIDAIVQTGPDKTVGIEEKIVRVPEGRKPYTAFTLETHSDLKRTPPDGWMYTSAADLLLYAFGLPYGLTVWTMPLNELRDWFYDKEDRYGITDTKNYRDGNEWVTRCRVVPIRDIPITKHEYHLFYDRVGVADHRTRWAPGTN
jgi:hypothetical protein